jgi:hypothetical protein
LMELLKVVHLGYLVDREGGWNAVQDWAEVWVKAHEIGYVSTY